MQYYTVMDRSTPYHLPHSTEVKGYTVVFSGDDRWYNNIFIGAADRGPAAGDTHGSFGTGTAQYDGQTASLEEYLKRIADRGVGDFGAFLEEGKQYVYVNDNAYFGTAKAYNWEAHNVIDTGFNPQVSVIDEGEKVFLSVELPASIGEIKAKVIDTQALGRVRLVDANYENPDGSDLVVDTDLLGETRNKAHTAGYISVGPIAALKSGANRIRGW